MTTDPPRPLTGRGGPAAWRQIELALTGGIERGLRPPGQTLASGAPLARCFGVNKATLRRALAEMAGKRLLRARNGLGTFVEPGVIRHALAAGTRFRDNLLRAGHTPEVDLLAEHAPLADAGLAQALDCAGPRGLAAHRHGAVALAPRSSRRGTAWHCRTGTPAMPPRAASSILHRPAIWLSSCAG